MKKLLLLSILLLGIRTTAQIFDPVRWSTKVEKIKEGEYLLIANATIDKGWHLYSLEVPEGGPNNTIFTFTSSDQYEKLGSISEGKGHTTKDPIFEMEIKYFEGTAVFKQKIQALNKSLRAVDAEVEFMVCDNSRCLPPAIKPLKFIFTSPVTVAAHTKANVLPAETKPASQLDVVEGVKTVDTNPTSAKSLDTTITVTKEKAVPVLKHLSENNVPKSPRDYWSIFIVAFLSGFAALLTPCVFPMIPMTMSFFTKQSKTRALGIRNAIIYGLSIIAIYLFLGSVVTVIFGADALNALATNVWFNIIFFVLLIVFATSFLGAFEIVLPSSWANKVDSQADKGGLVGIFFMALALAIVSFSCTGPIVGTLLVEAASKGGSAPILGMFGFSLAIALPFALFAAFPGWLNSLPKSGGWLNTVKVVLGFLELALAFKFLSQADLVLQTHLLEREVFIAIWIAVFGALAFYLFGKIQLPHDSLPSHISVGRLNLGLVVLTFTIYMIPGLWGAPLNLISAFPPPQNYSESPYGVGGSKDNATVESHQDLPVGAHLIAPHNIMAFDDYDKGVAYAKKVGKPVMIDFTGWACVNCRKMEQDVWPNPEVLDVLKNKVVLVSLYVDDKRPLADDQIVESKLNPGTKLRYIGQKWSEMQTVRYKANSQPYYVLIDHKENNLIDPVAFTPDAKAYLDWLRLGIANFKK